MSHRQYPFFEMASVQLQPYLYLSHQLNREHDNPYVLQLQLLLMLWNTAQSHKAIL